MEKTTAVAKYYGFERRTIFSTEGSFGDPSRSQKNFMQENFGLTFRSLKNEAAPRLGNPPTRHRGLPGPSGPEPQKSPKRVRKGVRPRGGPRGCATESEKSPKKVRSCVFGLFSDSGAHSLGTLGPLRDRRPRDPLSDSFRTLLGFRARRARETSVPGRRVPNPRPSLFRGVRQFVWNRLESVSCHFCGQGFWSSVE